MSLLSEPEVLHEQLHQPTLCVLDSRFVLGSSTLGYQQYRQSHIPGSLYGDLEKDFSGLAIVGQTGRHPLPDPTHFLKTIQGWGIDRRCRIVVYDDGSHIFAARAWWLLRWMGLHDVSILHGGFKAWVAKGYPTTTDVVHYKKTQVQLSSGHRPVVNADTLASEGAQTRQLIDARAIERFSGEVEPIDAKAGHIPGAICHPFTLTMDEHGRFLAVEQLHALFKPYLNNGKTVVFYCGSGVTACLNIWAMEYAGLGVASLYPGSWSEWITQPDRQVAVGPS